MISRRTALAILAGCGLAGLVAFAVYRRSFTNYDLMHINAPVKFVNSDVRLLHISAGPFARRTFAAGKDGGSSLTFRGDVEVHVLIGANRETYRYDTVVVEAHPQLVVVRGWP